MRLSRCIQWLLALLPPAVCLLPCTGCDPASGPPGESAQSAPAALVVVDPPFPESPGEVDLGHLRFGEVVQHSVLLRNASSTALTIRNIRPGCTCTQPRISYVDEDSGEVVVGRPDRPGDTITLPPGVTAELEFRVDTTLAPARNKHKLVIVRLTTDSPVTPFLTLNLRLFVESHFRPAPAVIDLRQVPVNGGGSGELAIASDNQEGRVITEVLESPLELLPDLALENVLGVDLWVLRVRLLPPVALGYHSFEVKLATTGPGGEGAGDPVVVEVRATGVPDAALEPQLVVLARPGPDEPAQGTTQLVARLPGQVLRVVSARVEGVEPDLIGVELVPRRPDAQGRAAVWDVSLTARRSLGETARTGKLVLETDDEQVPRLEASWVWRP